MNQDDLTPFAVADPALGHTATRDGPACYEGWPMDESPPPADPAHPELGPSEYAASAMGPPSRLTDDERHLLTLLALRRVADDLHISDQEAADLLDGYADRGDPCQFVGNQRAVAIIAGGVELFRADRAWLRAMASSADGTLN